MQKNRIFSCFRFVSRACKRLGTQCWICSTILLTEILIILKFDWPLVTKPFPRHIAIFWIATAALLVSWTIWQFLIKPFIFNRRRKPSVHNFEPTNSTTSTDKELDNLLLHQIESYKTANGSSVKSAKSKSTTLRSRKNGKTTNRKNSK